MNAIKGADGGAKKDKRPGWGGGTFKCLLLSPPQALYQQQWPNDARQGPMKVQTFRCGTSSAAILTTTEHLH